LTSLKIWDRKWFSPPKESLSGRLRKFAKVVAAPPIAATQPRALQNDC
jgi:hypothetical protein